MADMERRDGLRYIVKAERTEFVAWLHRVVKEKTRDDLRLQVCTA